MALQKNFPIVTGGETFQICRTCDEPKLLLDFSLSAGMALGRTGVCKACNSIRTKQSMTPEKLAHRVAKTRRQRYASLYGLSESEYEARLVSQNHCCASCGRHASLNIVSGRQYRLSVDHNHLTQQVRALLCNACNRAIGLLQDNPERLRQAAIYLETYG